jgi:SRSO17 transposase
MTLLDHPDARPLLQDAVVRPADLAACAERLEQFVGRYLPRFYRQEQRQHARTVLRGKLTGLQRKTTEPIAAEAGQKRRPLQLFVGAGRWDDRAVLGELHAHVAEELADDDAVFILDPSAFPKKGQDSCGVARQWCGRLGKVDNCQAGVFVAYAARRGCALLDAALYLPEGWAEDPARRAATCVPAAVTFREKWRIGLELLDGVRGRLPGRWVVGDDEFGRWAAPRAGQRRRRRG